MISCLEELRKLVGAEAPPVRYAIDSGSIKYFADSIMDPDPRYRVPQHAEPELATGTVAPPTFFGSAVGLRDIPAGDSRTMSAIDLPLPPGWATIATGDEFEFFAPVLSGMTLICRERFIDVFEKQGRSARLIFYTLEKTFSTAEGQPVMRRVLYCAAREPIPSTDGEMRDAPETGTILQDTVLPTVSIGPISVRYLAMFATATAEFVDIHYDGDFARSVGLPGPIIQGLYKTALVARMVKDWAGDGTLLRSLRLEHRRMDVAGTCLTAGGHVMPRPACGEPQDVECSVWVRNQHGMVTTRGSARVSRMALTRKSLR